MTEVDDSTNSRTYSFEEAAVLLGLTEDAVRKRAHRGDLHVEKDTRGRSRLLAQQIDDRRAILLRRLKVVERADGDPTLNDRLATLSAEVSRLRAENVGLLAALRASTDATRDQLSVTTAILGSITQATLPDDAREVLEK